MEKKQGIYHQPEANLDELITHTNLFSNRLSNTLARNGLLTLRILLMHSENSLKQLRGLGDKNFSEIISVIEKQGWKLVEKDDENNLKLIRALAFSLYHTTIPLPLPSIKEKVNRYFGGFAESQLLQALLSHPYIQTVDGGMYRFSLSSADIESGDTSNSEPVLDGQKQDHDIAPVETDNPITLSSFSLLWEAWIAVLDERYKDVLFSRFNVMGAEGETLQQTGDRLGITRSRAQQIESRGKGILGNVDREVYWGPLLELLNNEIDKADGILFLAEWEQALDRQVTWDREGPRPRILEFLCAIFDNAYYLGNYDIVTKEKISVGEIKKFEQKIKMVLRPYKREGYYIDLLVDEVIKTLPTNLPKLMYNANFIIRALDLFNWIRIDENQRCFYNKKKKKSTLYPSPMSGWGGLPNTRLSEWESDLRKRFKKIDWIGQLVILEDDFKELCRITQEEAKDINVQSKKVDPQPRLVPPAVFVTTMVFAARYSEQEADEFWEPYFHNVWNVEYSQAFMARCRKHFIPSIEYLKQEFKFEFPQESDGDLVRPIYRHALLPRYVQAEFAFWLSKNWQNILEVADSFDYFMSEIQHDRSIGYLARPLQKFILGKETQEAAGTLIRNMASAISLHVDGGETVEDIGRLLSDTPIEQEVWEEIGKEFNEQKQRVSSVRISRPRIQWVWSLDDGELALRVQNIVLPSNTGYEGEFDRLVWANNGEDVPVSSNADVEIIPWRMNTGEQVISDVFFDEPDGPIDGQIVLLTDYDEEVVRLDVPPYPISDIQFFRITQQGAYGIPIDNSSVSNGSYLICSKSPLTLLNSAGNLIKPNWEPPVPYPLHNEYAFAAQFTFELPVSIQQKGKKIELLKQGDSLSVGQPFLEGEKPVEGVSRQVQPVFASNEIALIIPYGAERLTNLASLWIRADDGWRFQQSIGDLLDNEFAYLNDDSLILNFNRIIPLVPNVYSVEIRISLKPVFLAPIQFAVVPGLEVLSFPDNNLHTLVNPPEIKLKGLSGSEVVQKPGMVVESISEDQLKIVWTDLRKNPHLLLRFGNVDVPLVWGVPRFSAWLLPDRSFLTLNDLAETELYAFGSQSYVDEFFLSVSDRSKICVKLIHGRYSGYLNQSQIYDVLRLSRDQHISVKLEVGSDTWTLFDVRKRPKLNISHLNYERNAGTLSFKSGLRNPWGGKVRFVVEMLSNPYKELIEVYKGNKLLPLNSLGIELQDGIYLLRIELDGEWLPINEDAMRLVVGDDDYIAYEPQLIQDIRKKGLISVDFAEDFVLWWAEIAEAGTTELSASTLYQLASVPAVVLENFSVKHLEPLWDSLANFKEMHSIPEWIASHGLFPAWLLLRNPLLFITEDLQYRLKVVPVEVAQGGLIGRGFARWQLSSDVGAKKELVYVEWKVISNRQVQVEAGLPELAPKDWTTINLIDTYGLYYCVRCGRIAGTSSVSLSPEIKNQHLHGHDEADLRGISFPEEAGGYKLLANCYVDNRSDYSLDDIFSKYDLTLPRISMYLSEPIESLKTGMFDANQKMRLGMLVREIKRRASDAKSLSFWKNLDRLMVELKQKNELSDLGELALAVGALLRTAANNRKQYNKLLKDSGFSEIDIQNILFLMSETAPSHLKWGLNWSELLYIHS